jgi:hypothetical protein
MKGEGFMKRTFAVAALLALVAVTPPAFACTTMPGFEPVNSAKQWKSWNSYERLVYLRGFMDGSSHVVLHRLGTSFDEMTKKNLEATTLRYDLEQIRAVTTSLYSDPANAYISLSAMVFIARDKLDGKNAEQLLTKARESDCEYQRSP